MAAGGDIIGSSTHIGNVHQAARLLAADRVEVPRGLEPNLPFRTACFVGREKALARLDAALATPGGVVVQALHGLGGVGKSTLAAQWAAANASEFSLIWWITADSTAAVSEGLAGLADALQPDFTRTTSAGQAVAVQERAAWAKRWLARHRGWLVVLDNVSHPRDVEGLMAAARGGRFLITSRLATGWHRITTARVRLDVLAEDEALRLLGQIAVGDSRAAAGWDGAAGLCAELGYLPLAIEQAAAYLHQTSLTPASYLALLAEDPAAMYDQAARGSDAERSIARIWRITLDALADTPAGHVLRILAWWAPQAIPRSLLDPLGAPAQVTTALGDLAAYNMITLDQGAVSVHRLVQAVARTPDPDDPHRQPADIDTARDQATILLDRASPTTVDKPVQWPTWRELLPHITALSDHTTPATDTDTTSRLLDRTAMFLENQGAPARAVAYLQRALAHEETVWGSDHPTTLTIRSHLTYAYRAAGELARAILLSEQVLADCERVLKDDHPHTLIARNNLANAYRAAGKLDHAIPLYERALADCERVLEDDDPTTLVSRNNLAGAYQEARDLRRAIPLFVQVLGEREQVLGRTHPDTLASRNDLALAWWVAGILDRATPLYEQTLADCRQVLGDDHPTTLTARNGLASAYESAGELDRAIPLFEQTLADCRRVLSDDHPITKVVRGNLEAARRTANLSGGLPSRRR